MDTPILFHQLDPATRAQVGLTMPDAFFVTGADGLQISSWNALAGVTLTIAGRFRNMDGEDRPFVFTHTPATNRTQSSSVFGLGDGWLLNVTVFASSAAPITGQTFVRLQLVRGLTGSGIVLGTLCAGYVTAVQPIAWPGTGLNNSLDGAGALRSITGAVPAAGAEISETVPTGARWQLINMRATIVTSAAVANRLTQWIVDDGVLEYGRFNVNAGVVASNTWVQELTPGVSRLVGEPGGTQYASAPNPLFMAAGHRLRTLTASIQAADQYSLIQYLVREWLEVN